VSEPAVQSGDIDFGGAREHTLASAALEFAQQGLYVFPLKPNGKTPLTTHGLDDATTDELTIETWWDRWPTANIGLRTGDLVVVDEDRAGAFTDLAQRLGHELPTTRVVRTHAGRHYYFSANGTRIRNSAGKLAPGVDTRGDGGYVVAPPSVHPSGSRYELESDQPLAPLPGWIVELLATRPAERHALAPIRIADATTPYGAAALEREFAALAAAPEGTRNDRLNTAAFALGQLVAGGEVHEHDARRGLEDAAQACGLPTLEADRTIRSGFESGLDEPRAAPERPQTRHSSPPAADVADAAPRGSFAERVRSRRVDLIARIRDGIPPAEYLPASEHMLRCGKRHHWPGPKKVGKSLAGFVHAIDVALAGGHVITLDRENGGDLYASRLEAIITARALNEEQQATITANLVYYEFPRFRKDDGADLVELCSGADLVIFDSQRMYLSDLGLEENSSDDYAEFMGSLIEPLFAVGIATLILDNTGHQEPRRGRGNSSKGDLNEILFALETVERFNLETTGKLRLEITESRFGNAGRWEMELGGGVFGSWKRVDRLDEQQPAGSFRPTAKMERASIFVEHCSEPVSRRTVTDGIGGNARYARIAVEVLVRERYFRQVDGPRGAKLVESLRPYREASDPLLQAAEEADRVPTASELDNGDRVPTASEPDWLNDAASATASDRVPTASATASGDRVPTRGFPYGEPATRDTVAEPPLPVADEAEVERLADVARDALDADRSSP
jgi:hypothetical protein